MHWKRRGGAQVRHLPRAAEVPVPHSCGVLRLGHVLGVNLCIFLVEGLFDPICSYFQLGGASRTGGASVRKMWEELERKGFDVDAKDGCCALKVLWSCQEATPGLAVSLTCRIQLTTSWTIEGRLHWDRHENKEPLGKACLK